MATRTSREAMIKLLDPDDIEGLLEDEVIDYEPFMETANVLVDAVCLESEYSDVLLELIERWLACHYFSIPMPKTKQEAAKGLTETTEGQSKLGLDFTRYGQQARILDYKGNLDAIDNPTSGKKLKGAVYYVGGE